MLLTYVLMLGIVAYIGLSVLFSYRKAVVIIGILILPELLERIPSVLLSLGEQIIAILFLISMSLTFLIGLHDFATGKEKFYISIVSPLILLYAVHRISGTLIMVALGLLYAVSLFRALRLMFRKLALALLLVAITIIMVGVIFGEPQDTVLVVFETPFYAFAVKKYGKYVELRSLRMDFLGYRLKDLDGLYYMVSKIERATQSRVLIFLIDSKIFVFQSRVPYELTISDSKFLRILMERPIKL